MTPQQGTVKPKRINLRMISARDLLTVAAPALLIIAAAFWIAFQFVKPAPPDSFVMSTGAEGGAYHSFALRYKEILARDGISVELRSSSGAAENLARLRNDKSGVDLAFVQSGTGQAGDNDELVTLGSVYPEPVWLFYRGKTTIDRLSGLRGKRIATGPEGSGTRRLVLQLLHANGIKPEHAEFMPLRNDEAIAGLKHGRVDAVFMVAAPEAPAVHELLDAEGVRLMHFSQSVAYTKRFPFLTSVTLPHGSIDLVKDIPPQDTTLVAPLANLVARDDLHPAIIDLMMQAMAEVHGGPGLFHAAHDFPAPRDREFPISKEAQRFYKSGAPFLQRYLPFWAATLIDRIVVLLIPIFAILIPIVKLAPPIYQWRIRSRLIKLYGELKLLEFEIRQQFDPARFAGYAARLDAIEEKAATRPIPVSHSDQLYTLRQHIDFVRVALERQRPAK